MTGAPTPAGVPDAAPAPLRITVNGAVRDVPAGSTLDEIVDVLSLARRGIAVAVDRRVVPRSEWAALVVPAGAVVEVVSAAAGG